MSIDPAWLKTTFPELANLAPINGGGQKSVFTGTHPHNGEIVLKLFHPGADPDRAKREVEAVVKIQSPRVPRIHEIGQAVCTVGPIIWVREQRLNGENLRERLQKGPLDPTSVMRMCLHIAEALADAEQNQIVHRDVKPENITIDSSGNFWLLDFGLARHLDKDSLTATGLPFGVGTLGYSPSEQFRNHKADIDNRADLFSLGVTLYECIEGRQPFRDGARDFSEVLQRVENMPLPLISSQIDPQDQMRDLVHAMSRNRRDHRPQSASDALAWIREICHKHGIA